MCEIECEGVDLSVVLWLACVFRMGALERVRCYRNITAGGSYM